jgi:hypothetical protein
LCLGNKESEINSRKHGLFFTLGFLGDDEYLYFSVGYTDEKLFGHLSYHTTMKVKISEHDVQVQILDFLRYNHFKFWRNNVGAIKYDMRFVRYGEVGSPDIMAIKNGKFYAIEVKSPTGKLSEAQELWLAEANQHGAIVIIAHSIDEFIEQFVGHDK